MSQLIDAVETAINEIKAVERDMGDDSLARLPIFQARRKLEEARNAYQRTGTRIPVIKELTIECRVCHKTMTNEEEYYLHLRKNHSISEDEATEESNRPRQEYNDDIQTIRRLMGEYTEADLEDDFTREHDG